MSRPMLRFLPPLLACGLILSGCDSLPTRPSIDLAVTTAEQDFAQGNYAQAAQGFLDAANAQRSQRDALRLRAAEAWREEGALNQAASALEGITTRRFTPDQLDRMSLLQAEIALSAQEPSRTLTLLDTIDAHLADSYRPRLLELRARAAEMDGNAFFAANSRAELAKYLNKSERASNTRDIQALLSKLDDNGLAFGAASLHPEHPLYPHVARTLTTRGLPLPHALADSPHAVDREEALADGYRPFQQIALLLPLESGLSAAANAVRDGFIAGYYNEKRNRPNVRVYNTNNTAEGALSAYQHAVSDGAQAIVGPLGRDEVSAILDANREGTVPFLALNRGSNTPPPPGSMSFAMSPEDEGSAAANRIAERGGTRVLLIHVGDDYAQRASAALIHRLQQRGGSVVATIHIPDNNPNYTSAIQTALKQAGSQSVSANGDLSVEQNRINVDVDAIFFSGRAEQARLLVPQLRVAGIYDVPILATSQITSGAGNARLDKELDGIEFTETPWLFSQVSGQPSRDALASLETTQGAGARLFAFGLDAFQLISYFEHIQNDPNAVIRGATGQLRYDGFGQVQRTPAWARFQGGRIQAIPETSLTGDALQFQ